MAATSTSVSIGADAWWPPEDPEPEPDAEPEPDGADGLDMTWATAATIKGSRS